MPLRDTRRHNIRPITAINSPRKGTSPDDSMTIERKKRGCNCKVLRPRRCSFVHQTSCQLFARFCQFSYGDNISILFPAKLLPQERWAIIQFFAINGDALLQSHPRSRRVGLSVAGLFGNCNLVFCCCWLKLFVFFVIGYTLLYLLASERWEYNFGEFSYRIGIPSLIVRKRFNRDTMLTDKF